MGMVMAMVRGMRMDMRMGALTGVLMNVPDEALLLSPSADARAGSARRREGRACARPLCWRWAARGRGLVVAGQGQPQPSVSSDGAAGRRVTTSTASVGASQRADSAGMMAPCASTFALRAQLEAALGPGVGHRVGTGDLKAVCRMIARGEGWLTGAHGVPRSRRLLARLQVLGTARELAVRGASADPQRDAHARSGVAFRLAGAWVHRPGVCAGQGQGSEG